MKEPEAGVLIVTNTTDSDSFIVQEALSRKGVRASLVHFADFPTRLQATLALTGTDDSWAIRGPASFELARPEVVWWRRPALPRLPEDLHPEDAPFAGYEWRKFLKAFWHRLDTEAVFINPLAAASRSDDKPRQLRVAREVGFTIPETVCGNDPDEIRRALKRWGGVGIYKPFGGLHNRWISGDDRLLMLFTSEIAEIDLEDEETVAVTPGIFQPRVDKEYELRVMVFGSTVLAAQILSQDEQVARLDWRRGQYEIDFRPIELPGDVAEKCIRLLRRLDLLAGVLDLIVTPQGDFVFLEINEGGQFIWLDRAGDLPVLDAFVHFLLDPREGFCWRPPPDPLRVADVSAAAGERMADAQLVHLSPIK